MSPLLLVVTGLPAAGKTTLATALARELRWPLVTKDDDKAILLAGLSDDLKPQFSKKVGKHGSKRNVRKQIRRPCAHDQRDGLGFSH